MEFKVVIDKHILDEYNKYYFTKYPKRRVEPIKKTIAPSLNWFTSRKRIEQNSVKQKYKEFAIWLAEFYNIANLNLDKAEFTYSFFFGDKRRRDYDNMLLTPKFLNDGFVFANVVEDDNGQKVRLSFAEFKYDKENPRTEIVIREIKESHA